MEFYNDFQTVTITQKVVLVILLLVYLWFWFIVLRALNQAFKKMKVSLKKEIEDQERHLHNAFMGHYKSDKQINFRKRKRKEVGLE